MDPNKGAKALMTRLHSQEQFEEMLRSKEPDAVAIILFTANWCGPCRGLKLMQIIQTVPNIKWYVCDVDDNDYTPGYCGVRAIPSFLALIRGKPRPIFTDSNTQNVITWVERIANMTNNSQ